MIRFYLSICTFFAVTFISAFSVAEHHGEADSGADGQYTAGQLRG